MSAASDFDVEDLLKATLALKATISTYPDTDLFSLSPLSSPDSTPHLSPLSSATSTPVQTPQLPRLLLPLEKLQHAAQPASASPVSASAKPAKESRARKRRKKEKSHSNRKKRRKGRPSEEFAATGTRLEVITKYVEGSVPVISQMQTQKASVANTAYVALDDRVRSQKIHRLHEISGLKLVEWDGR
jgi:hypothetical protein